MTVQLQMGKPVEVISGANKLKITLKDVHDHCSAEDARVTYICEAEVDLKVQLNDSCIYDFKNSLLISRFDLETGDNIARRNCNIIYKDEIYDVPVRSFSAIYQTIIVCGKLFPFTKTTKELIEMQKHKEQYIVTLYLIKRC